MRDYVALREDRPAGETLARYGVLYSDLVALAGLKPVTRGQAPARCRPRWRGGFSTGLRQRSHQRQRLAAVWDSGAATGAGADGARRG